jgi:hypothetical protein
MKLLTEQDARRLGLDIRPAGSWLDASEADAVAGWIARERVPMTEARARRILGLTAIPELGGPG